MATKESGIRIFVCALMLLFSSSHLHSQEIQDTVDIHGFISQGYLKSDQNNFLAETEEGSFQFNEMGLNFNQDVTHDLRIGIQFFSRDLGKNGNDYPKKGSQGIDRP